MRGGAPRGRRRRRGTESALVAQGDRQGVVAAIVRRGTEGDARGGEGGRAAGPFVWMPVLEGGVRKRAVRKMRMRICAATKESYTLLSKKR